MSIDALSRHVVAAIERDLRDRRGLRQEWEGIDSETTAEIRQTWAAIVSTRLAQVRDEALEEAAEVAFGLAVCENCVDTVAAIRALRAKP
jgi:hypothetical protein